MTGTVNDRRARRLALSSEMAYAIEIASTMEGPEITARQVFGGMYVTSFERLHRYWPSKRVFVSLARSEAKLDEAREAYWIDLDRRKRAKPAAQDLRSIFRVVRSRVDRRAMVPEDFLLGALEFPSEPFTRAVIRSGFDPIAAAQALKGN